MNELIDLAKGLLPDKTEKNSNEAEFVELVSNGVSSPDEIADRLGISHEEADAIAYGLLVDFFSKGRSAGDTRGINVYELNKGLAVEMEHTDNPFIAEKIVRDHLSEIDNYYTLLEKMEHESGSEGKYR